jgi:hypothetical protein
MQVAARQKIQVIKDNDGKATHVVMPIEVFQQVLDAEDEAQLLIELKASKSEKRLTKEEVLRYLESDEL